MNIFLTVLVALFLGAYYIFSAPSVRTPAQETEYAIKYADLRAIIECTAAVHNAILNGIEFQDVCVEHGLCRGVGCETDEDGRLSGDGIQLAFVLQEV